MASFLYKQTLLYFLPAFAAVLLGLSVHIPVYTGWLHAPKRRFAGLPAATRALQTLVSVAFAFCILAVLPFLIAGVPKDRAIVPTGLLERLCAVRPPRSGIPRGG